MKPVIIAFLIIIVLILLALVLSFLVGEVWAGFILSILSVMLTLFATEAKLFLDRSPNIGGVIPNAVRKIYSAMGYPDLSFLTIAILVLILSLANSFENTLTEFTEQGLVIFPENLNGFFHLRVFLIGNLSLGLFLGVLGFYGFNNGFLLRPRSFGKLVISTAIGFFLGIVIISLARGNWSGLDNFRKVNESAQSPVPEDLKFVGVLVIFGAYLIVIVLLATYVWFLSLFATFLRTIIRKTLQRNKYIVKKPEQNINEASEEVIIEKLGVLPQTAEKITSLKPHITLEDLVHMNGVNKASLKKAVQNFNFYKSE